MHYTVERLLVGDSSIVEHYCAAVKIWKEVMGTAGVGDVASMARVLSGLQSRFEDECGGRWIGQEVMAVAGIAQFYTTQVGFEGHEREVLLVYDALMSSFCSLEVKSHARATADSYDVEGLRNG